jgi:hypothetical protein
MCGMYSYLEPTRGGKEWKKMNFDGKLIDEEVASFGRAVQMFEIEIEHLIGKACKSTFFPLIY